MHLLANDKIDSRLHSPAFRMCAHHPSQNLQGLCLLNLDSRYGNEVFKSSHPPKDSCRMKISLF